MLTGYGTDALGEACVIGFTYAQTDNRALGFLAIGAALELQRSSRKLPYAKAVWQAYKNGRAANWLMPPFIAINRGPSSNRLKSFKSRVGMA